MKMKTWDITIRIKTPAEDDVYDWVIEPDMLFGDDTTEIVDVIITEKGN